MKKIVAFFIAILITFSVSACFLDEIIDPLGTKRELQLYEETKTEIPLSGDLFDQEVLKKVQLEWLYKPDGARNESFYSLPYQVEYTCYFPSLAEINGYSKFIFRQFTERKYLVGHSLEGVDNESLSSYTYHTVILSETLEDFISGTYPYFGYTFYYTADGKEWIDLVDRYWLIYAKKLSFSWCEEKNEEGLYKCTVKIVSKTLAPIYVRESQ